MYISCYSYVGSKEPHRFEFFVKSLASLLKSDFPAGTHLIVADDASKDNRVREILADIEAPKNCTIEFIFREVNQGCDTNMMKTMRECCKRTNEPFIVTCDLDVLYNRQWLNKLIEGLHSLSQDRQNKVAMLTCFDTKSHKRLGQVNEYLFEKKSCGGFCALVNRGLLMDKKLEVEVWDWKLIDMARARGYKFYCTHQSFVQHMGKGKSGNGLSWDTAKNFVGL